MGSRKGLGLQSSTTVGGLSTSNNVESQNSTLIRAGKTLDTTVAGNNKVRSRNALGDIGNRLKTNKGDAVDVKTGKDEKEKKPTEGKPFNRKPTVTFAVPAIPPGPSRTGASALLRNNAITGGSSGSLTSQAFTSFKGMATNLKNATLKSKISRTQSFQSTVTGKGANVGASTSQKPEAVRLASKKPLVASTGDWKVVNVPGTGKPKIGDVDVSETKTNEPKDEVVPVPVPPTQNGEDKEIDILTDAFSRQRFEILEIREIDGITEPDTAVSVYAQDIARYLFKIEKSYPVLDDYLKGRTINARMRALLVDWLVDVHSQFGYYAETIYMAVKTLDRFLQKEQNVARNQLQLVGVTALYLAAKFEEVNTPNINDFTAVGDGAYTNDEILRMEERMLKVIGFDLAPPHPVFFLRRCSKAANVTTAQMTLHQLAKYVMELALCDYTVVHLLPSQIAAGAFGIASMILLKKSLTTIWDPTLEHYSNYSLEQLKPVMILLVNTLARAHEAPNKLQAVTTKFGRTRAHRISKMPEVLAVNTWKIRILRELGLPTPKLVKTD